jgi:hypothetical protein
MDDPNFDKTKLISMVSLRFFIFLNLRRRVSIVEDKVIIRQMIGIIHNYYHSFFRICSFRSILPTSLLLYSFCADINDSRS